MVSDDIRCDFIKGNGARCRMPVFKLDGCFCLFHSSMPEARDIIRAAQKKGGNTPRHARLNLPGLRKVCFSLDDLRQFSNSLKESYIHGRINSFQLRDLTAWAAAHKKCIEALDVENEIYKLKREIQELKEGPDPEPGPIKLTVLEDGDGNALKLRDPKKVVPDKEEVEGK